MIIYRSLTIGISYQQRYINTLLVPFQFCQCYQGRAIMILNNFGLKLNTASWSLGYISGLSVKAIYFPLHFRFDLCIVGGKIIFRAFTTIMCKPVEQYFPYRFLSRICNLYNVSLCKQGKVPTPLRNGSVQGKTKRL